VAFRLLWGGFEAWCEARLHCLLLAVYVFFICSIIHGEKYVLVFLWSIAMSTLLESSTSPATPFGHVSLATALRLLEPQRHTCREPIFPKGCALMTLHAIESAEPCCATNSRFEVLYMRAAWRRVNDLVVPVRPRGK
jgi:hypothetical protein